MVSVIKSYIPRSVERVETITDGKFLKYILALDEESKINLVLVILVHF